MKYSNTASAYPITYTKVIYLLLLCLLILSCNNFDKTPKRIESKTKPEASVNAKSLYFRDSGYSSIVLKRDTFNGFPEIEAISRNQSFHFIQYTGWYTNAMLVGNVLINELSIQHSLNAPNEAHDGIIYLKTYAPNVIPIQVTKDFLDNTWVDSVVANEIYYGKYFMEAVLNRDEEKPVRQLLDYSSGKRIMEFSSELYGLQETDGYARRFIGYLEKPTIDFKGRFDSIPDLFGVLSYVNPITNQDQNLFLIAEEDAGPSSLWRYGVFDKMLIENVLNQPKDKDFKIENSELQHWYYSDFKKFDVVLSFKGVEKINLRIPIIDDKIDIHNLHSNSFNFLLK